MKKNLLNVGNIVFFLCICFLTSCGTTKNDLDNNVDLTNNKTESPELKENNGVNLENTNTYVIEYNFKTGLYNTNLVRAKVEHPVVFRIKNINRWAYDINVKSKDSILALTTTFEELSSTPPISGRSDLPSEIIEEENKSSIPGTSRGATEDDFSSKFKREKSEDVEIADMVKYLNIAIEYGSHTKDLERMVQERQGLQQRLQEKIEIFNKDNPEDTIGFNSNVDEVKSKMTLEEDSSSENNNYLSHIIDLKENIQLRDSIINKFRDKIDLLKIDNDAIRRYSEDNSELLKIFGALRNNYRSVSKINNYHIELYSLINDPQLLQETYTEDIRFRCDKIIDEIPMLQEAITEFRSTYYDLVQQYDQLKRNYRLYEMLSEGGVAKLFESADKIKVAADRMSSRVNPLELQRTLNTMKRIKTSLDNSETFEWVSRPFQPSKDVIIFDVDIQKREKTQNGLYNERKFRHREFLRGGTRIDLGIGLAASYFGNTPVYELVVKDSLGLSQINIYQKSNTLVVPSLLGLATMSYRRVQNITFGGSAGLGIDVVNGKIELSNFFGGLSAIFGKYDRLTLTGGGAVRNVRTLKSGYEVGDIVSGTADDINNFKTDKYKLGLFLALTYNLTSGVKKNISNIQGFY